MIYAATRSHLVTIRDKCPKPDPESLSIAGIHTSLCFRQGLTSLIVSHQENPFIWLIFTFKEGVLWRPNFSACFFNLKNGLRVTFNVTSSI